MAVIYAEDFNALSNGNPTPPPWSQAAATADIQSQQMRLQTSATAYASAAVYNNSGITPATYEMRYDATIVTATSTEFYSSLCVRGGSLTIDNIAMRSSWYCLFVGGTGTGYSVLYRVDGSGGLTFLTGGTDAVFVQGTVLHVRVRVTGTVFKIRYWKDAATEPLTWDIDFDDGVNAPTGTYIALGVRNGSDGAADRWDYDNFVIDNLAAVANRRPIQRVFA